MRPVRVRFAPSPTGFMHVGNVRAALLNWIFAKAHKGVFILRIEDTDQTRLIDPDAEQIKKDLSWLKLDYTEGPFFQSQRQDLYLQHLDELIEKRAVYRCFCTPQELERKREEQVQRGLPPRYDRTCLLLETEEKKRRLEAGQPFIWRLMMPDRPLSIYDLAHGTITYDLGNFSDPALTRSDGSVTFIFANFVDDLLMRISHVIRGEDHLSNTAIQAYLYELFGHALPLFYHLPIMVNQEGKKVSKREFGSSLKDLKDAGFLPQAVANYLGIIGLSLKEEILSLDELIMTVPFDETVSTGTVHYDLEKLRWVNHKWIQRLTREDFMQEVEPFLYGAFPHARGANRAKVDRLLDLLRPELVLLKDIETKAAFFFNEPELPKETIVNQVAVSGISPQTVKRLFNELIQALKNDSLTQAHLENSQATSSADALFAALSMSCKAHAVPQKQVFGLLRLALTGSMTGVGIKDLLALLDRNTITQRTEKFLSLLNF